MPRNPMNDLIVLVPGILGSELRVNNQVVWGLPEGIYEYLRPRDTLKRWTDALLLQDDDLDPYGSPNGVKPTSVLSLPQIVAGLVKTDGYDLMREHLDSEFQLRSGADEPAPNYIEFPYDWRRDNAVNAIRLHDTVKAQLEALRAHHNPEAKVIFICHSMGGLIAKYSMDVIGDWDNCRALITLGTPFRGSVNAVNYFANGYQMLGVDLSPVLQSCTAVYQLLPIYEMMDVGNGDFARVDQVAIPNMDPDRARAAIHEFHGRMQPDKRNRDKPIHGLIGDAHPTLQTAELTTVGLTASEWVPDDWPGHRQSGDGTVPITSAIPIEFDNDPAGVVRFTCAHAILQSNTHLLRQLRRMLNILQDTELGNINAPIEPSSATNLDTLMDGPTAQLRMQDLYQVGRPISMSIFTEGVNLDNARIFGNLERVDQQAAARSLEPVRTDEGWQIDIQNVERGTYRVAIEVVCPGDENPPLLQDLFEVANFDPC